MGSSPSLPLCVSLKSGLLPLVSRENTQRIWLVDCAQAKSTCPGSDLTSGFWHALVISVCTVATLDGHEAPAPDSVMTRIATSAPTAAAAMAIRWMRESFRADELCRPSLT